MVILPIVADCVRGQTNSLSTFDPYLNNYIENNKNYVLISLLFPTLSKHNITLFRLYNNVFYGHNYTIGKLLK